MKLTAIVGAIAGTLLLAQTAVIYFQFNSIQNKNKELTEIKLVLKQQTEKNKKAKLNADQENKRLRASLDASNKRLRQQIASSDISGITGSTENVCFNRVEFDRAIRNFVSGTAGLAGKGAQATVDLDTAKIWAQGLKN